MDVHWFHGTFNAFFLKFSVCLGYFCSNFNVFYLCFAGKLPKTDMQKALQKSVQKWPIKPLTARRPIDELYVVIVDWRFKFLNLTRNLTKCGATEGSTIHRLIDGPSWKIVDQIRDMSSTRFSRKVKYGATRSFNGPYMIQRTVLVVCRLDQRRCKNEGWRKS